MPIWLILSVMLVPNFFRGLEQRVPRLGTKSSSAWNKEFHGLEQEVPVLGMSSPMAVTRQFYPSLIGVPSFVHNKARGFASPRAAIRHAVVVRFPDSNNLD